MPRRFVVTLITAAGLLVGGLASAQSQIPDFQSGQVLRAMELNAIVRQLNANTQALNGEDGATHAVDCSSGTIGEVMPAAQPGDTIMITGTCNETVAVNKDGITLDGGGTAIIDGGGADAPVIAVYGQQNVVIRGLTLQKGRYGVLADRGAAVWLEDVRATDNGTGITISGNSHARFAGYIFANDNKIDLGFDIRQSSVFGEHVTVQANRNAEDGLAVHRGAQMLLFGASKIEVKANRGFSGMLCYQSCSISVVSSDGTPISIQVTDNNDVGIWAYSNAHLLLEGVDLTARDNGGHGLQVASGSSIETFGGFPYGEIVIPVGSAVFSGNGHSGISVNRNSQAAFFTGEVTISNNGGDGISAWNDADVNLADATFSGNGGDDIALSLASRLGWGGDTTSITISCDDSVLTYNGAACP